MKWVKILLTLWKYRRYDTVYCVMYTNRDCDVNIPIRRVKLVGLTLGMAFICTLDGEKMIVHRAYVADNKKEAEKIRQMCLNYEREQWYEESIKLKRLVGSGSQIF